MVHVCVTGTVLVNHLPQACSAQAEELSQVADYHRFLTLYVLITQLMTPQVAVAASVDGGVSASAPRRELEKIV